VFLHITYGFFPSYLSYNSVGTAFSFYAEKPTASGNFFCSVDSIIAEHWQQGFSVQKQVPVPHNSGAKPENHFGTAATDEFNLPIPHGL
jgi:hypothetical protein